MTDSQPHKSAQKIIPGSIRSQVIKGLQHYPELEAVSIEFKFKKKIKKSTMQAQPKLSSFFKKPGKRKYVILISERFHIEDDFFNISDLEDNVLIGWIGHELGHVMDYRRRSSLGMLIFAFKYLFSKAYLREVERTADTIAIGHGMRDYILATKNFILQNTDISPVYKARIKRLYLSPEEIMEMANSMEEATIEEEVDKALKEK